MQYNINQSIACHPVKLVPPSFLNQVKVAAAEKAAQKTLKEIPKHYSDAVVSNAKASMSIQSLSPDPVTRFVLWDDDHSLDYLRTRILDQAGVFMGDEIGDLRNVVKRRVVDSEFYNALKNLNIDNLAPITDGRGARGASILSQKGRKHLADLKRCGIQRVIDLRSEGNPESCAKLCAQRGLEYLKFPIAFDEKWSQESIDKLPDLIKQIRKGDYYIGCATGLHRTDTAVALNYIFDANSNIVPKLEAAGTENKMLAILNKIYASINDICYKDKDKTVVRLSEDFAQRLGWDTLDDLLEAIPKRKISLTNANKIIKKLGKF